MSLRALEFFSGIGGLHAALKQVKPDSTIVSSFDINPNAYKVYLYSIDGKRADITTTTRCALYSEGYHWDHVQVVLFTSFLVRMILSAMVPMCGFSVLLVNLIHVKE